MHYKKIIHIFLIDKIFFPVPFYSFDNGCIMMMDYGLL